MAGVRYTARTKADLLSIAEYTLGRWGNDQAVRYLDQLEERCRALAESPAIGRACDHIRPGLRRVEEGSHVIFYREQTDGILIVRILHERMLPRRHAFL